MCDWWFLIKKTTCPSSHTYLKTLQLAAITNALTYIRWFPLRKQTFSPVIYFFYHSQYNQRTSRAKICPVNAAGCFLMYGRIDLSCSKIICGGWLQPQPGGNLHNSRYGDGAKSCKTELTSLPTLCVHIQTHTNQKEASLWSVDSQFFARQ